MTILGRTKVWSPAATYQPFWLIRLPVCFAIPGHIGSETQEVEWLQDHRVRNVPSIAFLVAMAWVTLPYVLPHRTSQGLSIVT